MWDGGSQQRFSDSRIRTGEFEHSAQGFANPHGCHLPFQSANDVRKQRQPIVFIEHDAEFHAAIQKA
jgi:hypothetical protein